jgi:hypothetical protein
LRDVLRITLIYDLKNQQIFAQPWKLMYIFNKGLQGIIGARMCKKTFLEDVDRFFAELWSPDIPEASFGSRFLLALTAATYLGLLLLPAWMVMGS